MLPMTSGFVAADMTERFSMPPFVGLILSTLGPGMGTEPVIMDYARQQGLYEPITELASEVAAAGARARDSGLLRDTFDDNLRVYAPQEIWMFNLAADVIAMLGCLDGLSNASLADFRSNVRQLDQDLSGRQWQHNLKMAGDGPPAFQQLRARIPRHVPQSQIYRH
jgi:hypothetical protein